MNKKIEEALTVLWKHGFQCGNLGTPFDKDSDAKGQTFGQALAGCLAVIEAEMERIRMDQMLMDWIGAASAAESEGE